ncbi:DUF6708 domain-containing protein [Zemynaea arenosa]|uniref:DUF6708 domain-containing protein n=1 Tax=Zemynaea arenosa TaxID=2561931 RepID=UPI00351CE2C5
MLACSVLALSFSVASGSHSAAHVRFIWAPLYALFALPLLYIAFRWFPSEFFSLTLRPFRFHRYDQKIYAIRKRRSVRKGDEVWTIPWTDESIFCVHRGERNNAHTYHIRYYEVDARGNVTRGCSLGREWEGDETLPLLFAQWNYWCLYMRQGPSRLPLPGLFLAERETVLESFLTCMYWMGGTLSPATRFFLMPFFATFTIVRVLALRSCRDPVWPEEIAKRCQVGSDDSYAFPTEDMPVGWGATTLARQENRYPRDPKLVLDEFIPVG